MIKVRSSSHTWPSWSRLGVHHIPGHHDQGQEYIIYQAIMIKVRSTLHIWPSWSSYWSWPHYTHGHYSIMSLKIRIIVTWLAFMITRQLTQSPIFWHLVNMINKLRWKSEIVVRFIKANKISKLEVKLLCTFWALILSRDWPFKFTAGSK